MNKIDKQKELEGMLYNFHFPIRPEEKVLDLLKAVKDLVRSNGYCIMSNKYGQLELLEVDNNFKVIACCNHI